MSILRNFASINGNIWIEPGNLLLTKSAANNITAEAEIDAEFESAFGIYDLNEFLGVLSLFTEPELTFNDKYVIISEGKTKVKYFGADKTILTIPKKRMSFDLVGAESKVTFNLTQDQLQRVIKTASVMRSGDVTFVGNGKVLTAVIADVSNASSNSYSMEICPCKSTFSVQIKVENLKLIPGDYVVDFGTNSSSRFTNGSLVYHIALESNNYE